MTTQDHTKSDSKITQNLLPALGAILAQTIGTAKNWTNKFPSYGDAEAIFHNLPSTSVEAIKNGGYRYGMDPIELFRLTPQKLWEHPNILEQWLDLMDISHLKSVSEFPDLKDDPSNVIWEPLGANRSRGAKGIDIMTPEEYNAAINAGNETAQELLGSSEAVWLNMKDLYHGFQQTFAVLGYSVTWIPKEYWGKFMQNCLRFIDNLRSAKTWGEKIRIAKRWVTHDIKNWLENIRDEQGRRVEVGAIFMLGVLTLEMPALSFLVTTWAATGLLASLLHVLKTFLVKGEGYFDGKNGGRKLKWSQTLLQNFRMSVELLERWVLRIRNILDSIKEGIFAAAKLSVDLLFKCGEMVWRKFISPAATEVIRKTKTSFKKITTAVVGFLNWITGQVTHMNAMA